MASGLGPRLSRPGSSAANQRITSVNTAVPPVSSTLTPREPLVAPDRTKSYLVEHNYIQKDEPVSTRTLLKVLLTLADSRTIDIATLKHRIRVVVDCFNHHTAELLVETSTQFLGERLESLRKEAKDRVDEETSLVRKNVEEEKNSLERENIGNLCGTPKHLLEAWEAREIKSSFRSALGVLWE